MAKRKQPELTVICKIGGKVVTQDEVVEHLQRIFDKRAEKQGKTA